MVIQKKEKGKKMNELLDAAKSSDSKDTSEDRYRKLKEEKAGNDKTEAKKRYEKLKEEAKEEFVKNMREDSEEDETESQNSEGFITY